uniref:Uncharacterized protein n=1 Tax=Chromera velia CCMP2878 TaxID=1169474 RepID=A0A0G4HDA5_9ALVE|eukprot:Cvel_6367.t1-p1 / transcript=Cvel_6367.t1 / gene=Cvel_6367 / organism=Chromera_velia_CCMP2878 / gene_product=hypothetical protein / transcript_product=hypothetical protein / location=Cvel_scaffold310:10841-11508(-) / protein_length=153 / sequence_SO=supercontig / SO=protein_coding / is_pseudo=false
MTSQALLRRAQKAASLYHQSMIQGELDHKVILVLEEIGVTVFSPHNPLMLLHAFVDHGVEVEGKLIKLPIVTTSNYKIDPAKMGHGNVIYRGVPTFECLQATADALILACYNDSGTRLSRQQESQLEALRSRVEDLVPIVLNVFKDPSTRLMS